jgi:hypothetical protein
MTLEFNDILLYADANGKVKIEVIYEDETFWLSQKKMAELFGVDRSVISKHLKNIFSSAELDEKSTVQFLHIANSDKPVAFYNLDAIIAVGYRVNRAVGWVERSETHQFPKRWVSASMPLPILRSYQKTFVLHHPVRR